MTQQTITLDAPPDAGEKKLKPAEPIPRATKEEIEDWNEILRGLDLAMSRGSYKHRYGFSEPALDRLLHPTPGVRRGGKAAKYKLGERVQHTDMPAMRPPVHQ